MIKKILNIFLAAWILIFSSGFAINQHFCGKDMSMAGSKMDAPSCHSPGGKKQSQNNHCESEKSTSCKGIHSICCSEITHFYKTQDEHKGSSYFALKLLYTIAYNWVGSHITQDYQHNFSFQNLYSPPIGQDVIILVQSFLL